MDETYRGNSGRRSVEMVHSCVSYKDERLTKNVTREWQGTTKR